MGFLLAARMRCTAGHSSKLAASMADADKASRTEVPHEPADAQKIIGSSYENAKPRFRPL